MACFPTYSRSISGGPSRRSGRRNARESVLLRRPPRGIETISCSLPRRTPNHQVTVLDVDPHHGDFAVTPVGFPRVDVDSERLCCEGSSDAHHQPAILPSTGAGSPPLASYALDIARNSSVVTMEQTPRWGSVGTPEMLRKKRPMARARRSSRSPPIRRKPVRRSGIRSVGDQEQEAVFARIRTASRSVFQESLDAESGSSRMESLGPSRGRKPVTRFRSPPLRVHRRSLEVRGPRRPTMRDNRRVGPPRRGHAVQVQILTVSPRIGRSCQARVMPRSPARDGQGSMSSPGTIFRKSGKTRTGHDDAQG